MAGNKLLGCWGVIVGLFVALFLGWMSFEVLVHFFALLSTEGVRGALADAFLLHKLGELLIISTLVVATYVGVFRGRAAIGRFSAPARVPLWAGAALNLAARIQMSSADRFSTWTVVLMIVGALSPWVLWALRGPKRSS